MLRAIDGNIEVFETVIIDIFNLFDNLDDLIKSWDYDT